MKIVIASYNPVKLRAVANAFHLVFPHDTQTHRPVSVLSQVPDQPLTDVITRQGAINRVINAKTAYPQADFWVGIEGGVQLRRNSASAFAWVSIASNKLQNSTRTATYSLDETITQLIRSGTELGDAMDKLHLRTNSKQEEGAVGILSHGLVTRMALYQQAVTLCLIPFQSQPVSE